MLRSREIPVALRVRTAFAAPERGIHVIFRIGEVRSGRAQAVQIPKVGCRPISGSSGGEWE